MWFLSNSPPQVDPLINFSTSCGFLYHKFYGHVASLLTKFYDRVNYSTSCGFLYPNFYYHVNFSTYCRLPYQIFMVM